MEQKAFIISIFYVFIAALFKAVAPAVAAANYTYLADNKMLIKSVPTKKNKKVGQEKVSFKHL